MNRKKIGLLLIAIAGLMGASISTYAVGGMPPAVPHALAIPAGACAPIRAEDSHRAHISNGIFRHKGGVKGKVTLECAYPGGAIATHGYGPGGFSDARIVLRDNDADTGIGTIRVRFLERTGAAIDATPWYDSNVNGDFTLSKFRIDSLSSTIGPHILGPDTLGTFQVELHRSDTTVLPEFAGILLYDAAPMMFFP